MSGASLREIAEVLGNKSLAMTFRYSHLATGHMEAVVERMTQTYLEQSKQLAEEGA